MTVWRICARRHARHAFDGEGARRYGGRWNTPGVAVVYTSATLSLAMLELLVHAAPALLPDDQVAIGVEVPADVRIETVEVARLPREWRHYPAPAAVRHVGDRWIAAAASAVLAVPSVLVPQERNYLLNPHHPDFPRLRIGRPEACGFDPRLARR